MEGNVVISADDFGVSKDANRRILDLIDAGKINRVSVFTDGDIKFQEIQKLLNSGVKIDLHLDSFSKISKNKITSKNSLKRIFLFLRNYLFVNRGSKKTEIDWTEEIDKFQSIFHRNPDGLNSHQYIHFFPPYFKVIIKLKNKYDIPYIRFGSKGILSSNNFVSVILRILWRKNRKIFSGTECESSHYLVSLDWIKNINLFLNNAPNESLEIVTHPEREKEFDIIMKNF